MTRHRPHRRTLHHRVLRRRGDDGVALVAAIGVAVVCLMLATTVLAVAVRSSAGTGAGRDRAQASAAAEAGLDSLTSVFAGPATEWLSTCAHQATTPPRVLTAISSATTSTYATAVTFWSSKAAAADYRVPSDYWGVLDSLALGTSVVNTVSVTGDVPCLSGASAAYAQIDSRGAARAGSGTQQVQHMRAVVKLPQEAGFGLLGNTVDLAQAGLSVLDSGTSRLGIRTAAGDGSCGSSMTIHADVVVSSGKLATSGLCTIDGDVKAAGGVVLKSSTITGSVLTKPGMPVVRDLLSSTGPVSTSADDPAWDPSPLPRITQDLAAWTSKGFVVRPWTGSCSVASLSTRILTQAGPTIYDTRNDCPSGLTAGSSSTIRVTGGDVVLLVNGFNASGLSYIGADTVGRRVWLIAPAADTGTDCPAHNITFQSSSGADASVKLFVYSPCTVALGGLVTMTGQVWGGQVTLSSSVTVHFADLGIPSAGGDLPVVSKSS